MRYIAFIRMMSAIVGTLFACAFYAQGIWAWQQQCPYNEWGAACVVGAGCGYDANGNPIPRILNNWGLSRCAAQPSLPGPGSIVIFPTGANAVLRSHADVLGIIINQGAVLSWQGGVLTLRNPSDSTPGSLTNAGVLRFALSAGRQIAGNWVNTGTLVHRDYLP